MKTIIGFCKLFLLVCLFIVSACNQKKDMEYNEEEQETNRLLTSTFKGGYNLDPDSKSLNYGFEFQLYDNGEMVVIDTLSASSAKGYYQINGSNFLATYKDLLSDKNPNVILEAKLIYLGSVTYLEGFWYYGNQANLQEGYLEMNLIE